METLDLVVSEFNLGTLTTNAEAILANIEKMVEGYTADKYSEETIQQAKDDRATLNKLAERINKERLEYYRKWLEPFSPFDTTAKKIYELVKTASSKIDRVVKDVELVAKVEKRAEIEAWAEKYFKEHKFTIFTIGQIFNESWLNKTTTMKSINAEIIARISEALSDWETLEKMNEPDALAFYKETLDLGKALGKADQLRKNREAAKMVTVEIPVNSKTPQRSIVPPPSYHDQPPVTAFVDTSGMKLTVAPEVLFSIDLRITGTKDQLAGLRKYIDDNKMSYIKL